MKKPVWQTLSSKTVYKNKWIKVREDQVIRPDGKPGIYGVVSSHAPAVFIVPIDSENNLYLVKVFRYTTQEYSWEIPGGSTDGEDSLTAASRELLEEAGLKARKMEIVGKFHAMNGIADAVDITVLATKLEEVDGNAQEEEGIVELKKVHFKEVVAMIKMVN